MSSDEILYAFINLNYHLNKIINSYRLQVDFRTISRTKFDFVCQHLQPKQVKSLIFSDENIPNQVKLFHENFPNFQDQFIHLQSVAFVYTETVLLHFPYSVSCMSFQCHSNDVILPIKQILIRHAKFLTHIRVDDPDIFRDINTSFPELTHLTTAHSIQFFTLGAYFLSFFNLNSTIRNLSSPITHLHICITKSDFKSEDSIKNFEYLSGCLTHLSLLFKTGMNISFEFLKNYLMKFNQLTHLTIEAEGESDFINGLFHQTRKLDVSSLVDLPINKLNELLTHTSRLYHLVLSDFDPLLILPSHIRFLALTKLTQLADVDAFCNALSCMETVELDVNSETVLIELINQVEHIHNIILPARGSLSHITTEWFEQNSHRFKTKKFTYQIRNTYFREVHVSFSNK